MVNAAMGRATPSLREAQSADRDSTVPPTPHETPTHFATGSHEALFHTGSEVRCDMCGAELRGDDDDVDARTSVRADAWAVQGAGAFVWARGDEVRREKIPLCGDCATVVFASAVLRFDLDDEE